MTHEVTTEALALAREAGALVVDVRDEHEYAGGRVPGAKHLPLDTLPDRMDELSRDEPVYVICQGGGRSAKAAELMSAAGYDVRSVSGGTAAWISEGRDVESG